MIFLPTLHRDTILPRFHTSAARSNAIYSIGNPVPIQPRLTQNSTIRSFNHSVIQPFGHSVIQSFSHSPFHGGSFTHRSGDPVTYSKLPH